MPSSGHTSLHRTAASLYLITFILSFIGASTAGITFAKSGQHPSTLATVIISAFATLFALSATIYTFITTPTRPALWLLAAVLNTACLPAMIAVTWIRRYSAVVRCNGYTSPPFTTSCELRQGTFWCAVLAWLALAVNAVVCVLLYCRAGKAGREDVAVGKVEDEEFDVEPLKYELKEDRVE